MLKPAKRNSLRGRVSLGMKGLGQSVARAFERGAMALGGFSTGQGGYDAGTRSRRGRRTSNWRPGEGSPAVDIHLDLADLRGRSRDLERNNPLAAGAIQTKATGVVGVGLQLRSVLDVKVLGLSDEQRVELQYQIEREWEIFERECDFTGQLHFRDLQRLIYRSAKISGDVGIARRYRKRPGETYGTRLVVLEADRIGNPSRTQDTATLQAGVVVSAEGEIVGYHVADRHPGDLRSGTPQWTFVPRRGSASGMVMMLLAAQVYRPGQLRGVPLFATVEEYLKQLGDYSAAEVKAAINDAYLFAFEQPPSELDDEGNPIVRRPDGETDDAGELTLEDLAITTLPPGSKVEVKKPERPNTAFDGFVAAFCKQIGVALDIPYELLLKHFGASFSASRGALELAYKADQVDQAWLIRAVLDPIREWQFTEMVASGRFDAPGFFEDPVKRAAWLGRVWIGPTRVQINPQVESNADKTDIEVGVKTREQVMTERTGGDFDTKSLQILRERQVLGQASAGGEQQNDTRNNDGTDSDKDEDE